MNMTCPYKEAVGQLKEYDEVRKKADILCELGSLKMDGLGRINVDGTWMFISKLACSQILKRMSEHASANYMYSISPDLRCVNYNWLHTRLSPGRAKGKVLVRTMIDPISGDRQVRAVLVRNYKVVDDLDLLHAVGDHVDDERPSRMFIDRFASSYMFVPMARPPVSAGTSLWSTSVHKYLAISNSEVGTMSALMGSAMVIGHTAFPCGPPVRTRHVGQAKYNIGANIAKFDTALDESIKHLRRTATLKLKVASKSEKLFRLYGISCAWEFVDKILETISLNSFEYRPRSPIHIMPSDMYLSEIMFRNAKLDAVSLDIYNFEYGWSKVLALTQEQLDRTVDDVYNQALDTNGYFT